MASISLLVVDMFNLFIESSFNFGKSYVSRNYSLSFKSSSPLKSEF